jgi:dihydroxy-acid dehydratase
MLGLAHDGDRIEIDRPERSIHLRVSGKELAHRRTQQQFVGWTPAAPHPRRVTSALRPYAKMTTSAARGAARDVKTPL